jgi:CspA family cold shock protein
MATGRITRIVRDRGFGFIQSTESSEEVFFHSTSLLEGGFDGLQEGQGVEFQVQPDPRNPRRTRAADVRLTS